VQLGVRVRVAAVEVRACQGAAVVAVDDSIGIEHRYQVEHEGASELHCLWLLGGYEIQKPVHHVGGAALPRMHSCSHHHC